METRCVGASAVRVERCEGREAVRVERYLLSVVLDELAARVPDAVNVESLLTRAPSRAGRAALAIDTTHAER